MDLKKTEKSKITVPFASLIPGPLVTKVFSVFYSTSTADMVIRGWHFVDGVQAIELINSRGSWPFPGQGPYEDPKPGPEGLLIGQSNGLLLQDLP